jgi:DNA topoisomerase-1
MASSAATTAKVIEVATRDAAAVGLVYVDDFATGITRRRSGAGFAYFAADGSLIDDDAALARIRRIGIPPAWDQVWIAPSPDSHIQAVGRDARGRKQYRYHADFRSVRDGNKFDRLVAFANALPRLRRQVDRDMRRRGLPREKVIATVVGLLDLTLLRVGNAEYARQNASFGLTTLRDRHVDVAGDTLRFEFKGKSGKQWRLSVRDRRIARIVKSCQDLPGQHLFQYVDEAGDRQAIGSADVNAYLRAITGADVTAKDFRTWGATVLATAALTQYPPFDSQTLAKANLREAIEHVADELGNTPTICRKCYVHPAVIEAYLAGALMKALDRPRRARRHFDAREVAVLAFLSRHRNRKRRPANKAAKKARGTRNESMAPALSG